MKIMTEKIAELRVMLADAPYDIWRDIHLNLNTSLSEFHEILQIVIGWGNYHLYGFRTTEASYSPSDEISSTDNEYSTDSTTIKELIDTLEENEIFWYEYDLGDDWVHGIVLIEYVNKKKNTKYPHCVDGGGVCPPEDVGGIDGYTDLLDQRDDPDEEFLETLEHIGISLEDFKNIENIPIDINSINKTLEKVIK
jgi:hypothetical protein